MRIYLGWGTFIFIFSNWFKTWRIGYNKGTMGKTKGTSLVDKHLVLMTCARLADVVNNRPETGGVVEQDMMALKVWPSEYYYEAPLYTALIGEVRCVIDTFLASAADV